MFLVFMKAAQRNTKWRQGTHVPTSDTFIVYEIHRFWLEQNARISTSQARNLLLRLHCSKWCRKVSYLYLFLFDCMHLKNPTHCQLVLGRCQLLYQKQIKKSKQMCLRRRISKRHFAFFPPSKPKTCKFWNWTLSKKR